MNGLDIVLLLVIGLAVILAVRSTLVKRRKGGGCHGCDGACAKGKSCSRH